MIRRELSYSCSIFIPIVIYPVLGGLLLDVVLFLFPDDDHPFGLYTLTFGVLGFLYYILILPVGLYRVTRDLISMRSLEKSGFCTEGYMTLTHHGDIKPRLYKGRMNGAHGEFTYFEIETPLELEEGKYLIQNTDLFFMFPDPYRRQGFATVRCHEIVDPSTIEWADTADQVLYIGCFSFVEPAWAKRSWLARLFKRKGI